MKKYYLQISDCHREPVQFVLRDEGIVTVCSECGEKCKVGLSPADYSVSPRTYDKSVFLERAA